MKRNLLFLGAVALALWALWAQANHDGWIGHLRIDPVVYQARASAFLDSGSWAGLGTNEYQPGALWFFVGVFLLKWFLFLSVFIKSFSIFCERLAFMK